MFKPFKDIARVLRENKEASDKLAKTMDKCAPEKAEVMPIIRWPKPLTRHG